MVQEILILMRGDDWVSVREIIPEFNLAVDESLFVGKNDVSESSDIVHDLTNAIPICDRGFLLKLFEDPFLQFAVREVLCLGF